MMSGVYSHLLTKVFRFHETILSFGEPGSLALIFLVSKDNSYTTRKLMRNPQKMGGWFPWKKTDFSTLKKMDCVVLWLGETPNGYRYLDPYKQKKLHSTVKLVHLGLRRFRLLDLARKIRNFKAIGSLPPSAARLVVSEDVFFSRTKNKRNLGFFPYHA